MTAIDPAAVLAAWPDDDAVRESPELAVEQIHELAHALASVWDEGFTRGRRWLLPMEPTNPYGQRDGHGEPPEQEPAPQPAAGDLQRTVRAALAEAWGHSTVVASWEAWRGALALDVFVPVVVRLIEAHRAPLIGDAADRDEWRRYAREQKDLAEERRQGMNVLRDQRDEARAENASCGAEWVRTTEAEADFADLRREFDAHLARCAGRLDALKRAEAAVVEARKAALREAADALPEWMNPHGDIAPWLRDRADAQGADPAPRQRPRTDPGDGRTECETCGKFVWPVIHSCKGVPVTPAALARMAAEINAAPDLLPPTVAGGPHAPRPAAGDLGRTVRAALDGTP